MTPRVPAASVILPSRDRAHTLRRAIRSVLDQSFGDFELIVVDDASRDGTPALLAEIDDPRMRVVRLDAARGAAGARNAGAALARAPLLAFQDSDDVWLPDRLAAGVRALAARPRLEVAYSDMWLESEGRRVAYPAPAAPGRRRMGLDRALRYGVASIGIQSATVRRAAFEAVGGFDERLPALEDFELFVRLVGRARFAHLRQPLVVFAPAPGGVSLDFTARGRALSRIWRKHGRRGRRRVLGRATEAFYMLEIGRMREARGEVNLARRAMNRAARHAPWSAPGLIAAHCLARRLYPQTAAIALPWRLARLAGASWWRRLWRRPRRPPG